MKKHQATRKNSRSGAATVEFALTLPLLILMLFGAVELSHANMVLNSAEAAAYEGARRGIVPGAQASNCVNAAQSLLDIGGIRNSTITVTPADLQTSNADTVMVTIEVPYASNTIVAPLFVKNLQITRRCELTREKP